MHHGKGTGNYPALVALLEVTLRSTVQIRLRIPLLKTALPTPILRRDPAQTLTLLRLVHPLLMTSPLSLPILHPHLHPKGSHLSQRT